MADGGEPATGERTALASWKVEIGVAGLLVAVATLVIADSWRMGTGWGDEGPQSGFFPFYVGLILLASAGTTLAANLAAGTSRNRDAFVDRPSFGRVLGVLAPAVVFVVAANWLGLYVAAAILIAFFMRVYGSFPLASSAGLGVTIALVLFVAFEIWFVMPLPKGPLEAALGY